MDQKWVWAIKRSIVGVTKTTTITKKTCCKKAYIVAVRYSAAIIKRNSIKTHILCLFFFFYTTAIKRLKRLSLLWPSNGTPQYISCTGTVQESATIARFSYSEHINI